MLLNWSQPPSCTRTVTVPLGVVPCWVMLCVGDTVIVFDPERVLVAVLELVADSVAVVEVDPVLLADTDEVSDEELVNVTALVAVCEAMEVPDEDPVLDGALELV